MFSERSLGGVDLFGAEVQASGLYKCIFNRGVVGEGRLIYGALRVKELCRMCSS